MRRLELVAGTSKKFWQATRNGADLELAWGRIGTAGQTQIKRFPGPEVAQAELDALVTSKLKKGYVEVSAKGAAAKGTTAKGATAEEATAEEAPGKQTAAKRAASRAAAATSAPSKQATAKQGTASKAIAKETTAKQAAAKTAPAPAGGATLATRVKRSAAWKCEYHQKSRGFRWHDAWASDDGETILLCGDGGALLRSEDGGRKFTPIRTDTEANLRQLAAAGDRVFAVGHSDRGSVVLEIDGAHSKALKIGRRNRLSCICASGDTLWVAGWDEILRSDDRGASWDVVGRGSADVLDMLFDGAVYLVGHKTIHCAPDGRRFVAQKHPLARVSAITGTVQDGLFAVGETGLNDSALIAAKDGRTWTKVATLRFMAQGVALASPDELYVGGFAGHGYPPDAVVGRRTGEGVTPQKLGAKSVVHRLRAYGGWLFALGDDGLVARRGTAETGPLTPARALPGMHTATGTTAAGMTTATQPAAGATAAGTEATAAAPTRATSVGAALARSRRAITKQIEGGADATFAFLTVDNIETLEPLGDYPKLETLTLRSSGRLPDLGPLAALAGLAELTLVGRVDDLEGLRQLPHLERLELSCNVPDLGVLRQAKRLTGLSLKDARGVVDLAPLADLPSLEVLSLPKGFTAIEAVADAHLLHVEVPDVEVLRALKHPRQVHIDSKRVDDLSAVAHLSELEQLTVLRGSRVRSLAPLSCLPKLSYLAVGGALIDDLRPLAQLTALEKLDLHSNKSLSDLRGLEDLHALDSLDLNLTSVADLTALSGLRALRHVALRGTRVTDMTPLLSTRSLAFVYLEKSPLASIAGIAALDKLQLLWIWGTRVRDLSPLRGMALRDLDITALKSCEGLDAVTTLTALESLDARELGLSRASLSVFQKQLQALPKLTKVRV